MDDLAIIIGSKYRVEHGDEEPTVGVFKGYSAIGPDTGMVFQLDNGTLRYILLAQIVYLDLVESAPKKASKKKESGSVYYG